MGGGRESVDEEIFDGEAEEELGINGGEGEETRGSGLGRGEETGLLDEDWSGSGHGRERKMEKGIGGKWEEEGVNLKWTF